MGWSQTLSQPLHYDCWILGCFEMVLACNPGWICSHLSYCLSYSGALPCLASYFPFVCSSVLVSTTWHSNDDDVYRAPPIDRSILPTAPRAAREPNIDRSRLPKSPPYTAFLGNLPYDVTEDSIKDFFRGLNVSVFLCQTVGY